MATGIPQIRVLLVEDDEFLAEITAEVLRDVGADVAVAHSLREVQARAELALTSNLALLDINLGMAQPTGLDVHAWLAGHAFAGRVVFVTGHAASNPLVHAAAAIPHVRLVSKPYAADLLSELVEGFS